VQFIAYAITSLFIRLRSSERGQDLLEYALLGGLIAAAILAVGVSLALSDGVKSMVTEIGQCIDFDGGTVCNAPFN
jgi:Flp pilus assembly pilin Flp